MSKEQREVVADWLIVGGALLLVLSLFLTWSHQFSSAFLTEFGSSDLLRSVPHDPTAWQVYSVADVLLALLALALIVIALVANRTVRIAACAAVLVALAFTIHALGDAPTNGANIFNPALSVPDYFPNQATSGSGEIVAITAMILALVGLGLSFTAD